MNIFEQELRRLAASCREIKNPVIAGRALYGDLGGDNRVKLQFVTMRTYESYEALQATVLNRNDGKVDSLRFHFDDVWGKKFDLDRNRGVPHIWTYNGKSEWYAYQPTNADFQQLGRAVGAYLDVFTDRSALRQNEQEKDSGSVVKKIREAKQNPAPKKAASRNKTEPEL